MTEHIGLIVIAWTMFYTCVVLCGVVVWAAIRMSLWILITMPLVIGITIAWATTLFH